MVVQRHSALILLQRLLILIVSISICIQSLPAGYAAKGSSRPNPYTLVPPPPASPLPGPASLPTKPSRRTLEPLQAEMDTPEPVEKSTPERTLRETVTRTGDSDYVLGPGDEITIVDPAFGTDDEPRSIDTVVAPDGTISMYPIGICRAEGLTLQELTNLVNVRERPFVREPQAVIILKKPRPVVVYVLGDVANPGVYSNVASEIKKESLAVGIAVTLSATQEPPDISDLTVLTAIQLAGGLNETADVFHVKVSRPGSSEAAECNLWRLLVEGDRSQDVRLRAGDTVYVPRGGKPFDNSQLGWAVRRARPVRIIGEVLRPGLYYLGPNDDLVTILAKAGGFNQIAKQRIVTLSRLNHDGTVTTRIVNVRAALRNDDRVGRQSVQPGDVVVVGSSLIRRMAPTIGYVGAIVGLFSLIRVINASIPIQFTRNLNRGPAGGGGFGGSNLGGLGGFGAGLGAGALFGLGSRQGTSAQVIP